MGFDWESPGKPVRELKDVGGVQVMAEVVGVKTMADGGFRTTMDSPDSEICNLQAIAQMKGRVVIMTLLPDNGS